MRTSESPKIYKLEKFSLDGYKMQGRVEETNVFPLP